MNVNGGKPKPTHLKMVMGNPGKRPLPVGTEPQPARGIQEPPLHLSAKALRTWGQIGPMLDRIGVLTEADALALEMLCEAYADHLDARATLKHLGSNYYETTTQTGGLMHRAHPAVAVMQEADRRIKAWLTEFGKTPSSRTRLKAGGGRAEDPADKYFG